MYYFSNKDIYKGNFKDNKRSGQGLIRYLDGK